MMEYLAYFDKNNKNEETQNVAFNNGNLGLNHIDINGNTNFNNQLNGNVSNTNIPRNAQNLIKLDNTSYFEAYNPQNISNFITNSNVDFNNNSVLRIYNRQSPESFSNDILPYISSNNNLDFSILKTDDFVTPLVTPQSIVEGNYFDSTNFSSINSSISINDTTSSLNITQSDLNSNNSLHRIFVPTPINPLNDTSRISRNRTVPCRRSLSSGPVLQDIAVSSFSPDFANNDLYCPFNQTNRTNDAFSPNYESDSNLGPVKIVNSASHKSFDNYPIYASKRSSKTARKRSVSTINNFLEDDIYSTHASRASISSDINDINTVKTDSLASLHFPELFLDDKSDVSSDAGYIVGLQDQRSVGRYSQNSRGSALARSHTLPTKGSPISKDLLHNNDNTDVFRRKTVNNGPKRVAEQYQGGYSNSSNIAINESHFSLMYSSNQFSSTQLSARGVTDSYSSIQESARKLSTPASVPLPTIIQQDYTDVSNKIAIVPFEAKHKNNNDASQQVNKFIADFIINDSFSDDLLKKHNITRLKAESIIKQSDIDLVKIDLEDITVMQLKEHLRKRGINTNGKKAELLEKIELLIEMSKKRLNC